MISLKPVRERHGALLILFFGGLFTAGNVGAEGRSVWGVQQLQDPDYSENTDGRLGRYNPWQLPPSSFDNSNSFESDNRPAPTEQMQERAPWGWQFGQEPPPQQGSGYTPAYESLPGYTGGKRSDQQVMPQAVPGTGYAPPSQGYRPAPGYPQYPGMEDPSRVSPYLDPYPGGGAYGTPSSDLPYAYPPMY